MSAVIEPAVTAVTTPPRIRHLGLVDYQTTCDAMRTFTQARDADTFDEIWLCEHAPVFTLGVAGREAHIHDAADVPVVRSDRGGQVTYHGPGQVVAYPLIDLRRLGLHVKAYVFRLEQTLLRTLESVNVTGHRIEGAPGIYVQLDDPFGHAARIGPVASCADRFSGAAKIAALGVKVSRHCTYHGVALNVSMDLRPFDRIDPCGYAGLKTVALATLGVNVDPATVADELGRRLSRALGC